MGRPARLPPDADSAARDCAQLAKRDEEHKVGVVKIAIIEDHSLIRDMLVVTCGNVVADAEVRGASTASAGLELCRTFQPDLVFLDLVLPDGDGLDILPELFAVAKHAKVIALTSHTDEFTVHRALRAHVHGFVDKDGGPLDVLREAILTVMDGKQYFSSTAQRLRAAMREDPADFAKLLSDHEQNLLALFGEGLDNEAIARLMAVAPGTVKRHRANVMHKLGIHSTPQLIRYALEKGFTRVKLRRVRATS